MQSLPIMIANIQATVILKQRFWSNFEEGSKCYVPKIVYLQIKSWICLFGDISRSKITLMVLKPIAELCLIPEIVKLVDIMFWLWLLLLLCTHGLRKVRNANLLKNWSELAYLYLYHKFGETNRLITCFATPRDGKISDQGSSLRAASMEREIINARHSDENWWRLAHKRLL